jgi:hypothetical protein
LLKAQIGCTYERNANVQKRATENENDAANKQGQRQIGWAGSSKFDRENYSDKHGDRKHIRNTEGDLAISVQKNG